MATAKKSEPQKPQAKPGPTLADFRAAHDLDVIIPSRIRKALADMRAEHRERWYYEADFLKLAGVANQHISGYRDQFAAHIVETRGRNPKKCWFGNTDAAAEARG
jgi:hypothetical protein